IESSSGLKEDEIKTMVKDAEAHASDDKRRREEVTVRNETDQLIYQTEKNLNELGDKISADDKGKLEAAVERAKEALKKGEHNEILSARDGLNAAWHEAAQKVYSQAQSQQPDGGQAEPQAEEPRPADESGAVDADYEVVD
ncbi:Hsp70 family protein, partial [Candidatus Latescibacterota bacterium]